MGRTSRFVVLVCFLLLIVPGCQQVNQSSEQLPAAQESEQETTTTENEQPGETSLADGNEETDDSTATDSTETSGEQGSTFTEQDLIVSVDGQNFSMLEDTAGLLSILGDEYAYNEAESCVYDGMDKTFDYGQVIVYTVPSGDIDLLDGIDILDQSIATSKGIQVGSSREDVLAAYGQPADDQYDLTYNVSGDIERVGDPRLTFYLDDDDNVNLISYYSGSNAQN